MQVYSKWSQNTGGGIGHEALVKAANPKRPIEKDGFFDGAATSR